jgi:hypothetical protein
MPFDENNFKNPKELPCTTCKHFTLFSNPPRCKAFPDRIPDDILDGIEMHRSPVRGDHGIQYEPE